MTVAVFACGAVFIAERVMEMVFRNLIFLLAGGMKTYMFPFISRREVRTVGRGDNALGHSAIWAGHSAA